MSEKQSFGFLARVLNGGIAGITSVVAVFPVDLVKTRMQNQVTATGIRQYNNMFDCCCKIVKNDGFFGLYKGCRVNALLVTPEKAMKLVGYDVFKMLLRKSDGSITSIKKLLAAASAGCCQAFITTPMDIVKIQLQMSSMNPNMKQMSTAQMAIHLTKQHGVLGFYKGCSPTVCRNMLFSTIYFPVLAALIKMSKPEKQKEIPFYTSFMAALISATIGAFTANPLDVIKTRMQTLKGSSPYSSLLQCGISIVQKEGFFALYKGVIPNCLVVGPTFAVAQMFYCLGIAERLLNMDRVIVID